MIRPSLPPPSRGLRPGSLEFPAREQEKVPWVVGCHRTRRRQRRLLLLSA